MRGTSVSHAVSSAQAAQVRCEAPQMPHTRGVTTRPGPGSEVGTSCAGAGGIERAESLISWAFLSAHPVGVAMVCLQRS